MAAPQLQAPTWQQQRERQLWACCCWALPARSRASTRSRCRWLPAAAAVAAVCSIRDALRPLLLLLCGATMFQQHALGWLAPLPPPLLLAARLLRFPPFLLLPLFLRLPAPQPDPAAPTAASAPQSHHPPQVGRAVFVPAAATCWQPLLLLLLLLWDALLPLDARAAEDSPPPPPAHGCR